MPNLTKLLFKYYFKLADDVLVPLGPTNQRGSLMAAVYLQPLWERQSIPKKIFALLRVKWRPDNDGVQEEAKKVFMNDFFGSEDDFGPELFELQHWHHHRKWNFDHLNKNDDEKAQALQGTRLLTGLRHRKIGTNEHLHLYLVHYSPLTCALIPALMIKVPVMSIRFALEIQEDFTFNAIREAGHPHADELIAYLYETLNIQQKLASGFHSLLINIAEVEKKQEPSSLTLAEMDVIGIAENLVNNLKATIEKVIVILGLTHGMKGLEESKTHKKKLSALDLSIPQQVKELPYYGFVRNFISSEEIEKLNSLRNGINHKKGIAKLQPHNFFNKENQAMSLIELFGELMEQHRKNTAIFICVLALLTDDLVRKAPPDLDSLPVPVEN